MLPSFNVRMIGAGLMSLLLHIVIGALLIVGFAHTPAIKNPIPEVNIVNAVSVDKKHLEKELSRLKAIDEEKLAREKKRVKAAEEKVRDMENKRKEEERKLAVAKQNKERERKQREQEEQKLLALEKEKAALEKQRKLEEKLADAARQREADAEAKRREAEEAAKALEDRRAQEERQLARLKEEKEEAEAKRRDAEKRKAEAELAAELAAEQKAEQVRDDQTLKARVIGNIKRRISNNFNRTGLPDGLKGVLQVHLVPGGEVIDVSIKRSSGNDVFDSRAILAAQKASPLPVPDDVAAFDRLGFREITLNFEPID